MAPQEDSTRDGSGLKQSLRRWQIFFIVLTAVIGGGVFSGNGSALEIAGPAGFLTAIIVFGLISIAVLDGVSEFTQLFPVKNALPEYTKAFVDRDLGWVVGIAYWYTFSATFAVQNLAAANLSRYWHVSQLWQTLGFYVLAPVLVLGVNLFGVAIFGWIESVSGVLKLMLAFGTAITLYALAGIAKVGNNGPINDGFEANVNYVDNHASAVCYAIPLVAFSYLGQEIFLYTAYEAKYAKDLRLPSRILPYVVLTLYLLIGIGEALNVKWTDPNLPKIYGGLDKEHSTPNEHLPSASMVVISAYHAGQKRLAGFLNACLIFSVLSASNTSLYVASRTLYGLATQIPDTNAVGKRLQWLKVVPFRNGVPAWALVISALTFIWLPFLQLKKGYAVQDLQEILSVSASISLVLVWVVLCVAFIRYCNWLSKCRADVPTEMPQYHRNSRTHKAWTVFGFAQPFMAWLGILGCSVVLAFASATWWDTPPSFAKVAVAYAAPVILIPLWLILKLTWYVRGHGWGFVKISNDVSELADVFSRLEYTKPADLGSFDEGEHNGLAEEVKGFQPTEYSRGSQDDRGYTPRAQENAHFRGSSHFQDNAQFQGNSQAQNKIPFQGNTHFQGNPHFQDNQQWEQGPEVSPVQEYPPQTHFPAQQRQSMFPQNMPELHDPSQARLLPPNTYAPPQPHLK